MRGKRAKEIRQQVFSVMTLHYQLGISSVARYRISADGRQILCDGARALYREAKQTYNSLCRGENLPGTPFGDPAKAAKRRTARAKKRAANRGPKALERVARECPLL